MQNTKHQKVRKLAYEVILSFPKAKNGQPFLTLQNGRKVFFNRFVRKYGLDGDLSEYKAKDIVRRVRLVEFFDYFIKDYPIKENLIVKGQKRYIIESHFHRMVIIDRKVGTAYKLELLSFYPL